MGGAAQVTGQLPSPPLFFGCWRSLRSCAADGGLSTRGQGAGNRGGNKRRRSAGGNFLRAGPDEGGARRGRSGHVQSEGQQPKNVEDTTGPGTAGALRRTALDPTAGRASGRPLTGGEPCEPCPFTPRLNRSPGFAGPGDRRAGPPGLARGNYAWRSAAGDHGRKPANRAADRRGHGPGRRTGHPLGPYRGGRVAGRRRRVRRLRRNRESTAEDERAAEHVPRRGLVPGRRGSAWFTVRCGFTFLTIGRRVVWWVRRRGRCLSPMTVTSMTRAEMPRLEKSVRGVAVNQGGDAFRRCCARSVIVLGPLLVWGALPGVGVRPARSRGLLGGCCLERGRDAVAAGKLRGGFGQVCRALGLPVLPVEKASSVIASQYRAFVR